MKKMRKRVSATADELTAELLMTDPELKRLGRRLKRQENRLRTAIGLEPYKLYLDIEETHNERSVALARCVWAAGLLEARKKAKRGIE